MSDAIIDEELVQRLQKIAEREHRSVTEVVRAMVEQYDEQPRSSNEALLAMDGMFDDDIEVVQSMVEKDDVETPPSEPKHKSKYPDWLPRTADSPDYDPIDDLIGMFDDDITDLSSMTKEDVMDAYRKKYGDST